MDAQIRGGLDGTSLKRLAAVLMLVDHIGAVLLEYILIYGSEAVLFHSPEWYAVYRWDRILRTVGRLSFPIFCLLLSEGFLHTGNRKKYFLRLVLFALLSEIPFDLAVFDRLMAWEHQSVMAELALGLLTLWAAEEISERTGWEKELPVLGGAVLAGCLAAEAVRADYGAVGILYMAGFYYFRASRGGRTLTAGVLGVIDTAGFTVGSGALSAAFVYLYNGRRRQGAGRWRYAFYGFYPVHLLVLFLIRRFWLGISAGG